MFVLDVEKRPTIAQIKDKLEEIVMFGELDK